MKTDVHTLFSTLRQLESTGSSSPQFCAGSGTDQALPSERGRGIVLE